MAEELKIVIDADVQGAIAGVKKMENELSHFATGSIAQLRKAAAGLKTQLENLTPSALKSNFGKQLSGALKEVEKNLKSLESQSGITGEKFEDVFKKLGRQVGDFATLIPSIAIGTVLASASGLVEDFVKKLFEGKMALSQFAKASSDALGKSGEESVKLQGLVSIARDVTLSTKERKAAIDQLQEAYPAYLKNINLENINSAATTKAINDLTDATFNKALADQFATLAAKKQVEVFEKIQKIRSLADIKGSTKSQAVRDLASTGIRLENERLDKLIAEREDLKEAFKNAQVDFFKVERIDPTKDLQKQADAIRKAEDEIISRARQFAKEFGNAFIVPNLEESFFKNRDAVLKLSKKLLNDFAKGNLKIKLPVQVITELDFLPDPNNKITDAQLQELTKGFFEGVRLERGVPLEITFDPSLAPGSIDKINKKLDLKKQFEILGKIGTDAFNKIDFSNINDGIAQATKQLKNMMDVANTLNQAIGGGLVNAFNSVFDSILEGKSVFKALGEAIKQLVVGTIKAIAQMLILKAITNLIFPGGGGAISGLGRAAAGALGGSANFGGLGGSPFSNIIQIVGDSRISGNDIVTSYSRTTNSNSRFGG